MGHAGMGWGESYQGGLGHIRVGWVGNYRVLLLEMPLSIKSNRTIMELQVIESLIPKY